MVGIGDLAQPVIRVTTIRFAYGNPEDVDSQVPHITTRHHNPPRL